MRRRSQNENVLPVTSARNRLFDLVEKVLTGERARIELSHRGYEDHVVLVRKAMLEGLEADLARLRTDAGLAPGPLRGLGRLNVPPDRVLSRSRARQNESVKRKRAELVRDGGAG